MKVCINSIILVTCFFASRIHIGHSLYPQYLQTFQLEGCAGPPTSLLETNEDIQGTGEPGLKKFISWAERGLWRITLPKKRIYTTVSRGATSRDCTTTIEPPFIAPAAAINLLPFDLEESSLGLFHEKYLIGNGTIFTPTDTSKKFATAEVFKSWAYTGTQDFALYEGSNFDGNVTCLKPTLEDKEDGWGISYDVGISSAPITVGSIKRECPTGKNKQVQRVLVGNNIERMSRLVDENGKEIEMLTKVELFPKVKGIHN